MDNANGIQITEIKFTKVKKEPGNQGSHLLAHARIVLNGAFCVNNIRIVEGKFIGAFGGLFLSWPREFSKDRGYNLCYPITKALQDYLSEVILSKWISENQPANKG